MLTPPNKPGSKIGARQGTTAVEFAVAISIFVLLVFGIIEVGRGFMVTHLLANAARNGARTGILASSSNSDVTTAVNNTLANEGLSGATTKILVNGAVADVATAQSGDQITVVVSMTADQATWLPGARILTGTLSGEFALRRE
jgi:Flp pilus assembly protein TadG